MFCCYDYSQLFERNLIDYEIFLFFWFSNSFILHNPKIYELLYWGFEVTIKFKWTFCINNKMKWEMSISIDHLYHSSNSSVAIQITIAINLIVNMPRYAFNSIVYICLVFLLFTQWKCMKCTLSVFWGNIWAMGTIVKASISATIKYAK